MSLHPSFWRKKWGALAYFNKNTSAFGAGLIVSPHALWAESSGTDL